jgi:hypothetical protein
MLAGIRSMAAYWTEGWGDFQRWPISIAEEFRAAERGGGGSEEWRREMDERVAVSKDYLTKLKAFTSFGFPSTEFEAIDIWRQAFELGLLLYLVVTCIEAQGHLPHPTLAFLV